MLLYSMADSKAAGLVFSSLTWIRAKTLLPKRRRQFLNLRLEGGGVTKSIVTKTEFGFPGKIE